MLRLSFEKTYLVSQACEALCYGFFMCIFLISVHTHLNVARRTMHSNILFSIACAMFVIATWHFVITFYRTVHGLSDIEPTGGHGGAEGFFVNSRLWHAIMRDVLYLVQCLLGDFAAIYRCWILWDRDYRVVLVPFMLLLSSIVSGSMTCYRLATNPSNSIFAPGIWDWIAAFYALGLGQNTITSGLIVCRLWLVDRRSIAYNMGQSHFYSTMLLLVESAALFFAIQIVVLTAFLKKSDIHLVLLGSVPPIIGTAFTLMTIRVAFRSRQLVDGGTQTRGTRRNVHVYNVEMDETIRTSRPSLSESIEKYQTIDSPVV